MITDMDKPLPPFITCSAAVMPETMTAVAEVTETKARTITGRIVAFGTKSNDNRREHRSRGTQTAHPAQKGEAASRPR